MNAQKFYVHLVDERRKRRDELFEGALPSMEKLLLAVGYDRALSDQIAALAQTQKGLEDDE